MTVLPDQLDRIARKFEPRIRDSLLRAFAEIKNLNTIAEIETALTTGGIEAAMGLINQQTPAIIGREIIDDLDGAIVESGRASITVLPPDGVIDPNFRFSILNPKTAAFVQQYEFNLIREISGETLQAVRNSVFDGVITGQNPRETARDFRRTIGLTSQQERAVRNYRSYLENLDSQALRRELRDKRFDSTIRRAIDNNDPLSKEQVDRMTGRYREKSIRYRSEVIARTESMRATSIGNQEAMDQMVEQGAVDPNMRKFWVISPDERVRSAHTKIGSMNPEGVEVSGTFITPLGPLRFPRDPSGTAKNTIQCRCAVVYRMAA